MEMIEFEGTDSKLKKDLWVNVYSSVIDGLFLHDLLTKEEKNARAREVADQAVADYDAVFKEEDEE